MNNTLTIISEIEKLPIFGERFTNLTCININKKNPQIRQGCFSLIFSAIDSINDEMVIIKIFDPSYFGNPYRELCFERESKILSQLLNKHRCLQLKSSLNVFKLIIPFGQSQLEYPLKYFVTQHLPIDILNYFNESIPSEIGIKLILFKEIILAIRALHSHEIVHRDLKPDNLRGLIEGIQRVVIAIDLGTAINSNLERIFQEYDHHVGHQGYASPEAYCGFNDNIDTYFYTDIYAIGCMLYELFCKDLFYISMNKKGYLDLLEHCRISFIGSQGNRINKWRSIVSSYKNTIPLPNLEDESEEIPKSILPFLNRIIKKTLCFDFRERISTSEILRLVEICIKIVNNQKYQKYLRERSLKYKQNKRLKLSKATTIQICRGSI